MKHCANDVTIYALGDYYGGDALRSDCHRVRYRHGTVAENAATKLAHLLPHDAVLVSIPSRSGYNEEFTDILARHAHLTTCRCLRKKDPHVSTYETKKRSRGRRRHRMVKLCLSAAPPQGRIILIDNVIATGATLQAAMEAIGHRCDAACIAVNTDKYLQYNKHGNTIIKTKDQHGKDNNNRRKEDV